MANLCRAQYILNFCLAHFYPSIKIHERTAGRELLRSSLSRCSPYPSFHLLFRRTRSSSTLTSPGAILHLFSEDCFEFASLRNPKFTVSRCLRQKTTPKPPASPISLSFAFEQQTRLFLPLSLINSTQSQRCALLSFCTSSFHSCNEIAANRDSGHGNSASRTVSRQIPPRHPPTQTSRQTSPTNSF